MTKKKYKLLPFAIVISIFIIILSNIAISDIAGIPNNMFCNYQEVQQANDDRRFGKFITVELCEKDLNTGSNETDNVEVIFKLFGLIPIKRVSAKTLPEEDVYVGGSVIGLNITTDGAVVISDRTVNALNSQVIQNKFIKTGDIIREFNDIEIQSVSDLKTALGNVDGEQASLKILRNGKEQEILLPLIKNDEGEYKLGLWVRDDFSGVGTLTFVLKEGGNYGALGHAITNGTENNIIPIADGDIYLSNIVNIEKGSRNKPGELQCVFVEKNCKGDIQKNTNVGIFGTLIHKEGIIDANKCAKLGGRLSVKVGPAKLISCVSGIQEEYDIEIIKVNSQNSSSDKSFVFRVKDVRLLELTGGIVQGMSGSPIMQDGKIVGAVTHVFISDPTKGYGVYTDWMLENLQ